VNMKKLVINSNPQNLVVDFLLKVLYITTFSKKSLIVKLYGKEKRLNISLQDLYEKIESMVFIRCHKSFIVNVDYI
ncbi:LytTR family DNA-binding domain-containing protein, partial [Clostridium perfringens]|uniref:LytTR family DNA-binding domain-containing protein n=1 Tax=Clostridium perfringens TaxID=1502 RepID=UPI003F438A61